MIIHESYECEFCGKVFDEENECENHELICQYEYEKNQYGKHYVVRLYNHDAEELPIDESLDPAKIRAIYVESEEAINWVICYLDRKGYGNPWDDGRDSLEKENGFYYFDNVDENWKKPDDIIRYWQSVKDAFKIQ